MELIRITAHTRMTNYLPVPRSLLELELPASAILLYGLLLDRSTLSQKNDFTDTGGWVYVVYPILELGRMLHLSHTSVKNNLHLLEKQGLVRKIRRSRKEANHLYLYIPKDSVTETGTERKLSFEGKITDLGRERKPAPINRKEQQDFINLYQQREEESL